MPLGDGTGPAGQGSMTGRGLGYCAGYNSPGYMNGGFGRGLGRGFGRGMGRGAGRGFGRRFWTPQPGWTPAPAQPVQPVQPYQYSKEQELANLKAEKELAERDIETIKNEINEISARIKELEKNK